MRRSTLVVAAAAGLGLALVVPTLRGNGERVALAPALDAAQAAEAAVPAPKGTAADFTLSGPDGKTVRLKDLRGKVVILSFWATWCPPCRMEMPHLEALHKKYKGKPVRVMGINLDLQGPPLSQWQKKNKLTFPSVSDIEGKVASQYEVRGIPALLVIDQKGQIRYRGEGFDPGMESHLSRMVDGLLKQK